MAVIESAGQQVPVRDRVSADEWAVRVDLAGAYRLCAQFGWDDWVYTHLSARVPGQDEHILLNPFGILFREVTASNLCKVDLDGNLVMESELDINPAGYVIHSAVHAARHDAGCVMHLHTVEGVGVACQRHGLLPLGQTALAIYADVRYHDYEGLALDEPERDRLVRDLSDSNFMILRGHGLLTAGATVGAAFHNMYSLQRACQYQLAAMTGGAELIEHGEAMVTRVRQQARGSIDPLVGDLRWSALRRMVDTIDPSYAC